MDTFWEHAQRILDIGVVVVPVMVWASKQLRRITTDHTFTKSVAQTHLPNVYERLHQVDGEEHPSIVYLNGEPVPPPVQTR